MKTSQVQKIQNKFKKENETNKHFRIMSATFTASMTLISQAPKPGLCGKNTGNLYKTLRVTSTQHMDYKIEHYVTIKAP